MEIWKKIDHLDKYLISNTGKLKNEITNKILKSRIGKRGYLVNTVSVNGKVKTIPIHRMIALCFIPNPENKSTVNHIDGNKLNNSIGNLEWATFSENQKHAYNTGLKFGFWLGKFGKNNHRSRKVIRINTITKKVKKYNSLTDGAKDTGVSIGNISRVLSGIRKTTKGYTWKYI